MAGILRDMRYAARILAKSPLFTAMAVLTLTLGIGGATSIFSVIYGVLLKPLPYPHSSQIVRLWEESSTGHRMNFADPNFDDVRAQNLSLAGMAGYGSGVESVGANQPTRTRVAAVSKDFFKVIGVQPAIGRSFAPDEQSQVATPTAIVAYNYWKNNLGGNADLSAIKLSIEKRAFTVVGVFPPNFAYPEDSEIWIPRELYEQLPSRTAHNWRGLARLRDGVTLAQARQDLSGIAGHIKKQYGEDVDLSSVAMVPLQASLTGEARPVLFVLLAAVGFLFLIACANVANMTLAQAASRERELAIRAALGAGRLQLVRQFLAESFIVSLLGGIGGVVAAIWGVQGLIALAPQAIPRLREISINVPTLIFALGLSLLVALGLGVFSAWRATSAKARNSVRDGGQRETGSLRSGRLAPVLISGQVGAAFILLIGAGLLGRSLLHVLSVAPGFQTERIATLDLALPPAQEEADKIRRVEFLNQLFDRLRELPGVIEVGGTACLPLTDYDRDGTFVRMNANDALPKTSEDFDRLFRNVSRTGHAEYCAATSGYFRALGIPLIKGRLFDDRDTLETPHVALISESLAKKNWPNQDPVGKQIEFGNMDGDARLLTVVGVVGDVRESNLETPPSPTVYVDYSQRPQSTETFTVVMRSSSDSISLFPGALATLRDIDPNVPPSLNTFHEVLSTSLAWRRFSLILVGVFSCLAFLLAGVGIYGVTSYAVSRRTREFGVRMALGAEKGNVLQLVLSQGLLTTAIGLIAGIGGALLLTKTIQSMLFNTSPFDPLTFGAVGILLLLATLLACYLPALRATRVDPMVALRYE